MEPSWGFNLSHVPQTKVTERPPQLVTMYSRASLLGLPAEVRLDIWQIINDDLLLETGGKKFGRPENPWAGLILTSRKISEEIFDFWPRFIVPYCKVDDFLAQPYKASLAKRFYRLSLELPFGREQGFYLGCARALHGLGKTLRELRLFFVGQDSFGVQTFLHGCGSREASVESTSKKLVPEGQLHRERQEVFYALLFLYNLRSLVIENANYPLLQSMVIQHKPYLEHLHISTDPRTSLHTCHNIKLYLVPASRYVPPIKALHISTNSAMISSTLVSKVMATLEDLTWIVPDSSRQVRGFDWLRETSVLITNLRDFAPKIRKLRICIEAPIYEGHNSYGWLIGSLNQNLPLLCSLRILELHIWSKSPWLGREIIRALPDGLRRFYTSDKLISAEDLEEEVTHCYLTSNSAATAESSAEEDTGLVGEDEDRRDFIRLRTGGDLGFIGYEYNNCENTRAVLLRLNARLLDREKNSHLAIFDEGRPFPKDIYDNNNNNNNNKTKARTHGQKSPSNELEAQDLDSEAMLYYDQIDLPEIHYFGGESDAQLVFEAERVAHADGLPSRCWPVEAHVADHDHWLSED